jgi:hypothetical protein
MNFPYTAHHEKGVSCVDCHLNHLEDADRDAHTMADHSFQAALATCNKCHADQMHMPTDAAAPGGSAPAGTHNTSAPLAPPSTLAPDPAPVSPLGYATLAALIGLAGGMVMAPWLERSYRRLTRQPGEGD